MRVTVYEVVDGQCKQTDERILCHHAHEPSQPLTVGNDRWRLENLRADDPATTGDLLVLDAEPEMSGLHAQIRWTGARWRVQNLSTANPLRVRPWGFDRPIMCEPGEASPRTLRYPRLAVSFEPGAVTWLVCEPYGDDEDLDIAPRWEEALSTYPGTVPAWVRGYLAARPWIAHDEPGWDLDDARAELHRPSSPAMVVKILQTLAVRFEPNVAWPPSSDDPRLPDAKTAWATYMTRYGGAESTPRMLLDKVLEEVTFNRAVFSPGVPRFARPDDFLTFLVECNAMRYGDLAPYLISTEKDST